MQEKPVHGSVEPDLTMTISPMAFDRAVSMGRLQKFQEPARFQKAQFNFKLYKQDTALS